MPSPTTAPVAPHDGPLEDSWATQHIHMRECKAPSPPLWRFCWPASLLQDARSLLSEVEDARGRVPSRMPSSSSSPSHRACNFGRFWSRSSHE
ncbi:hypothetical protein PVAP13_3NG295088 [Panicum virgatum]|uniref:Uncharacterized protein n=1 Tax=Panicum virgatum TaxID=38727 RepID=A0A8T0UBG9_PANVG|nr:hypothetical protein PVAP13_3NG295088 [Panicum virgatum]